MSSNLTTSQRTKLAIILVSLGFAVIYYFTRGNVSPHGPFTYRIIVDPASVSEGPIKQELRNAFRRLPLWIAGIRSIQAIVDFDIRILKIPGIVFTSVLIYSCLQPLPKPRRIIVTFASIAGPLAAITYTFQFRRYYLNISIMLIFILLIFIFDERSLHNYFLPLIAVFTGIMWWNHYTFWPFFAVFSFMYAFLSARVQSNSFIVVALIIAPLMLYLRPAEAYVRVLPALIAAILAFDISDPSSIFSLSKGQNPNVEFFSHTIPSYPGTSPTWLSLTLHTLYLLPIILLCLVWICNNRGLLRFYHGRLSTRMNLHDTTRVVFLSAAVAFLTTSMIYVFIGFLFRVFTFWPIILPLFFRDLSKSFDTAPNSRRSAETIEVLINSKTLSRITVAALVLLSVLTLGPVFPYEYIDEDQPAIANQQQIKSSEFIRYVPSERTIYTDLLHKSIIVYGGGHDDVVVGRGAAAENDMIGLDRNAAALYDPSYATDGYPLLSHSGTEGWVIRDATVILPERGDHARSCSEIYSNGNDALYADCTEDN